MKHIIQEIEQWRDDHWDEIIGDLAQLVAIQSVEDKSLAGEDAPFGPGPRAALDLLLERAFDYGFEVADGEGYVGTADLPGNSGKTAASIAHCDVVAAGDGWSFDPYALTEKDGYFFGRGVVDNKGPLVITLHAARYIAQRCPCLKHNLRLIFGCGEETAMDDIKYYRAHNADPDFLMTPDSMFPLGYGEAGLMNGLLTSAPFPNSPILEIGGGVATNAVPATAYAIVKGPVELPALEHITLSPLPDGATRINAQGVSAHAARPELGDNAIKNLVEALLAAGILEGQEAQFFQLLKDILDVNDGSKVGLACEDEHFGTLTCVGGIVSKANDAFTLTIDVRYPTTTTCQNVVDKLNAAAKATGPDAAFALSMNKDPFLMNPDSAPIQALMEAYRSVTGDQEAKPLTSKGGTYARCFTTAVSFGIEKPWVTEPSWVGSMHAADEAISEAALKEAFTIYALGFLKLMECDL